MSEHVRVDFEWQLGLDAGTFDKLFAGPTL